MTSLHPLTTLLAQTERERDMALADQLRAQTAHSAAVAQAEQLLLYRREYEQRWQKQFASEGKIELVRCYQGFMERLTQAVDQQARNAEQTAQQAERAGTALRAVEVRCTSVRRLIERRVRDLQANADRREQKQTDEQAARAAWGRTGAHGSPHAA
jgi:flagellar protein FliJ